MTSIEELEQQELENLSPEDEVFELEQLITDGADAKIPITISFPKPDGKMVKAAAMIRPLTNVEWNNCTRLKRPKNDPTTNEVELVKKALYTKDGEPFPPELVEKIPNGVIVELMREISRISGVNVNSKENLELMSKLMGF